MDEVIADFYVTLPSNSSINYFPENTQSSYRTKLISPLILNDSWECGISEIFFPHNWFNVDAYNKDYTIQIEEEKNVEEEYRLYTATCAYENDKDFFLCLNNSVKETTKEETGIQFVKDNDRVNIYIRDGFELHITKEHAPKLLYMFHLPNEDIVIKDTRSVKFRPTIYQTPQIFNILDRNPLSITRHSIPLTTSTQSRRDTIPDEFLDSIIENIEQSGIKQYATFTRNVIRKELEISVFKNVQLYISKDSAPNMLRVLGETNDVIIEGVRKFSYNPFVSIPQGESIDLIVKEYPTVKKIEKHIENLSINVGIYKSVESLLREFKYISLKQMPDRKLELEVPRGYEVTYTRYLADMLGLDKYHFTYEKYNAKYPLELNAGISEILVYSDIIESHHVGDTYAPVLRVIPCLNEKMEQIVKRYDQPIYFPVKKNFVDTIQIELKTSSGRDIVFTGGKTFVLLSFRRKKSIN